jgi:hypothetical protein
MVHALRLRHRLRGCLALDQARAWPAMTRRDWLAGAFDPPAPSYWRYHTSGTGLIAIPHHCAWYLLPICAA